MRIIAGLFMFIGLIGLVNAGDDILRTRPYADGNAAAGIVVSNAGDPGYYNAVVEFADNAGLTRQAQLSTDGWLAPGTELQISYRSDDLTTVRAPQLRTYGGRHVGVFAFIFASAIVLFFNPWTKRRTRSLLKGKMLQEPELLLSALKPRVEPVLDEPIKAAFPVVLRRPLRELLVLPALLMAGVGIWAALDGSDNATALYAVALGGLLAAFTLSLRSNGQSGVVAVTEGEYILFPVTNGDLNKLVLGPSLPRSTPLPPLHIHRHTFSGGPIPFATGDDRRKWHYQGVDSTGSNVSYATLIRQLAVSASDHPAAPASATGNVATVKAPPAALAPTAHFLSADAYLADTVALHHLVDEPIIAALPIRSTRAGATTVRPYLATTRRHSLLVSHYTYFLVRHSYGFQAAEVTARFPRQATDLGAELATRHRRLDKALSWVNEVAAQL